MARLGKGGQVGFACNHSGYCGPSEGISALSAFACTLPFQEALTAVHCCMSTQLASGCLLTQDHAGIMLRHLQRPACTHVVSQMT